MNLLAGINCSNLCEGDWAVQKRGEVVKEKLFLEEKCDVEIPRVPSPGMNQAELDKLEGTENKENDFIKPFHIQNDDSDNEELAHPLDLENMFKKPFDKVKTPVNEVFAIFLFAIYYILHYPSEIQVSLILKDFWPS